MTASELMQQVLRMQAQARQLGEALATYEGWQDIPGENAAYCAAAIESIGQSLTGIRDTLREEMQAASREHIGEEGPGASSSPTMDSSACAVCGRPSRYLFAFPSGEAGAGVVYDGAPVCSPECAQELRTQRNRAQGTGEEGEGEGASSSR